MSGLPNGYEERSREEWVKLSADTDPQKRKIVSNCIRDLGVAPTDYMGWDTDTRVDYIMKAQEAGGGKTEEKTAKGKDKAKAEPAETSTKGSAGGGVDAATKKAISDLQNELAAVYALNRKIHDLLVISVLSDKAAKNNAEEMDVELKLLGND